MGSSASHGENPYDVLEIQPGASSSDIKKSYVKLALENHPDKGGDEEAFKRIQEAYDKVKTPETRALWENRQLLDGNLRPEDVPALMQRLFGLKLQGSNDRKLSDLMVYVPVAKLDLEEGASFTVPYTRQAINQDAYNALLARRMGCPGCKGEGYVRVANASGFGFEKHKCQECSGQSGPQGAAQVTYMEQLSETIVLEAGSSERCLFQFPAMGNEAEGVCSGALVFIFCADKMPKTEAGDQIAYSATKVDAGGKGKGKGTDVPPPPEPMRPDELIYMQQCSHQKKL